MKNVVRNHAARGAPTIPNQIPPIDLNITFCLTKKTETPCQEKLRTKFRAKSISSAVSSMRFRRRLWPIGVNLRVLLSDDSYEGALRESLCFGVDLGAVVVAEVVGAVVSVEDRRYCYDVAASVV